MVNLVEVRKAMPTDSEAIYKLALQLGYFPNIELVQINIEKMLEHQDYELVVAVNESKKVIGWMSLNVRLRIEDVPFLQIAALVTDETVRGKGTGRLLMSYAAEIAVSRGLSFIGLHSSKHRTEAHAFYDHIGYHNAKESFFFKKEIKPV